MACKSRSLVNYRSDKTVVFSEFVKFQRAIWRNADKTVSKWRFSDPCVWQRSHFWLHFEAGKSQFAMVNIWCCQNFGDRHRNHFRLLFEPRKSEFGMVNIWGCQNLGDRFEKMLTKLFPSKFECLMSSAQKPHSAAFWSWEDWIWNGQRLMLPKFWKSISRNADKIVFN